MWGKYTVLPLVTYKCPRVNIGLVTWVGDPGKTQICAQSPVY